MFVVAPGHVDPVLCGAFVSQGAIMVCLGLEPKFKPEAFSWTMFRSARYV